MTERFLTAFDHISQIAESYGVTGHDILSGSRRRQIVKARQHCYWHFRERGRTYPEIARLLKMKDHAAAIHGRRMHMQRNGIFDNAPATAGYSEGLV